MLEKSSSSQARKGGDTLKCNCNCKHAREPKGEGQGGRSLSEREEEEEEAGGHPRKVGEEAPH